MAVDGSIYNTGNYTLQPFSSKILMRETSSTSSSIVNPEVMQTTLALNVTVNTENQLKIKSFPNPTNLAFGITVTGGTDEKIEITALSSDGKVVYENIGNTNRNYSFGNNFLPGTYIIKVVQGDKSVIIKVIKI